jgi:uncharacterized protein (TIGR03437 family)
MRPAFLLVFVGFLAPVLRGQTALACGEDALSAIAVAGEIDFYNFTVAGGDAVTIRLVATSGGFGQSIRLELYSPAGAQLANVAANLAISNLIQIERTLTPGGTYSLVVSGSTVSYRLIWQKLNAPCRTPSLACGQQALNTIGAAGEHDFFILPAGAGDATTIRLTATSGGFGQSLRLEVFSPTGTSLFSGAANLAIGNLVQNDRTFSAAGNYVLVVSGSPVSYRLVWQTLNRACAQPTLSVAPSSLSFSARAGGVAAPLALRLGSSFSGPAWQATARTTSGGAWLAVAPGSGFLPADLSVTANAAALSAGTYRGEIELTAAATPATVTVPVTFTVEPAAPPSLAVEPSELRFTAAAGATAGLSQALEIANRGGGTLGWSASVATAAGAWLTVSSASGQTPATLLVAANPTGLPAGSHSGAVTIRATGGTQTIVVAATLVVAAGNSAILLLDQSNLLFRAVEGGGAEPPQAFSVLNLGDGTMAWSAETTASWIRVAPASGSTPAGAGTVPQVTVSVVPTGLAAGLYNGEVRVIAPNANNAPHVVRVDLQVLPRGATLGAVVRPSGLVFVAGEGGTAPAAQEVVVSTTSPDAVEFVSQPIGGAWVSRTPDPGVTASGGPGRITVSANTAGLAAGVYRAGVTVLTRNDGALSTVSLLLVVTPRAQAESADGGSLACASSQLLLQPSSVATGFQATVGWPTTLTVQARDNCGEPAVGGTVTVSFSSGDPPLVLNDLRNGQYSASWRPGNLHAVTLTFRAQWRGLPASLTTAALVGQHPSSGAPQLSQGGVLLGAGFTRGPSAPGSILSIFGQNLTSAATGASSLPLPRQLGEARILIGEKDAPLFFAGPGQINAQLPAELPAGALLQLRAEINGVPSAPELIQLVGSRPGIFTLGDAFGEQGAILIANSNRLAMPVTEGVPSEPATAGGVVSIYCTGLGATDPPVASGLPAPGGEPLARVVAPVAVTIGGKPAAILFAGMAPGFVGVYQVNVTVPEVTGDAVGVSITVAGATSNIATMAVR